MIDINEKNIKNDILILFVHTYCIIISFIQNKMTVCHISNAWNNNKIKTQQSLTAMI